MDNSVARTPRYCLTIGSSFDAESPDPVPVFTQAYVAPPGPQPFFVIFLTASFTDVAIPRSYAGNGAIAPTFDDDTADMLLRMEDVLRAPSFFRDDPPRVSGLEAPLPVTVEEVRGPPQHSIIQVDNSTRTFHLKRYIVKTKDNDSTHFWCGYPDCSHDRFYARQQVISHIRSVHLKEKPFKCATCEMYFVRKQDATRHVRTMNEGKKYECTVCHKKYARKDYRDKHERGCQF
ncbi:hypothetical protein JB92DRAFT_3144466 [Gautieria morchelliformis]|nr:hypothetical protein JB92DRAFT_3144466 [Gautieria morchelliformis]